MNGAIFDAINDGAGHTAVIDDPMKWAAEYLLYAVVLVAVGLWFWGRSREARDVNRRLVLQAALSGVIALGLVAVIQHFYQHPRPFAVRGDVHLVLSHSADPSFPSEHVAVAAAVAGAFFWGARWVGIPMLLAATVLAFARVFVGIHYPADVAAALALGLAVSYVVVLVKPPFDLLQRSLTRCMPPALR
jgi:undecaprenyl-diphosphatase